MSEVSFAFMHCSVSISDITNFHSERQLNLVLVKPQLFRIGTTALARLFAKEHRIHRREVMDQTST